MGESGEGSVLAVKPARNIERGMFELEGIRPGDVFENYKELCNALDVGVKDGRSKRYQLEKLAEVLEWRREGNKYIVERVRERDGEDSGKKLQEEIVKIGKKIRKDKEEVERVAGSTCKEGEGEMHVLVREEVSLFQI